VDARQQAVRVVVGLEDAIPDMENMVLIGTGTKLGAESVGTVAVLAPTRIRYNETIQAVSYIAQLSERILQTPRSYQVRKQAIQRSSDNRWEESPNRDVWL
jgi:heat-inducible transcriptional repressor